MKELEEENRKLKGMYAELTLDLEAERHLIAKSSEALPDKTDCPRIDGVRERDQQGLPDAGMGKTCYYYVGTRDDGQAESALRRKALDFPREDFWKAFRRLRRKGHC